MGYSAPVSFVTMSDEKTTHTRTHLIRTGRRTMTRKILLCSFVSLFAYACAPAYGDEPAAFKLQYRELTQRTKLKFQTSLLNRGEITQQKNFEKKNNSD